MIFVEKSPRYITASQAEKVITQAPLKYVGVFLNHSAHHVAEIATALCLHAVQLHGNEDAAYIDSVKALLPEGCQVWKALGVEDSLPEPVAGADRHLLDTKVGEQSGGTGKVFDWELIAEADKNTIMIAGGLSADNAELASQLGTLGLDFNSGVESAPGVKDHQKLAAAFAAVRRY